MPVMPSPRARTRAFTAVRTTILVAVLGYVTWEFFAHAVLNKAHPSVHALCPLGGLESLLRFITAGGSTLQKIFAGTMGLFFVSVLTAVLFRRSFCGVVCPLGTLQELVGNLGRVLLPRRFRSTVRVPVAVDRVARFAKYAVLALTVVMAWITGTLWIQAYDPWVAYGHVFKPAEALGPYLVGFILLVVSLLASFFIERAFCKYLCPMGALTALVGLVSPFRVRRNAPACTSCLKCDAVCPTNVRVSALAAVRDPECISCGKCVPVCPAPGAIEVGAGKLRLHPIPAVVLAAGIFFAGSLLAQALGLDRWSGRAEPTLREMARQMGVSPSEFRKEYGLPAALYGGTRSSAVQDAVPLAKMAELNGVTAAELKEQLGLPAEMPDDTRWGRAYGEVHVGVIAGVNGLTVEQFRTAFGLDERVTADTPWKDVKTAVTRAMERAQAGAGHVEGQGE